MARTGNDDLTTLQMALVGYELEKRRIEEKISEIRSKIKGRRLPSLDTLDGHKKSAGVKRNLSAAARARIAAAQRKRWAEHRKRVAQAAKA